MSTMDPVKWFKQVLQELDVLDHRQFYALVEKYKEQFMTEGRPLGKTGIVKHSIYTRNHVPIKQRPRREPLGMKDVIKEELQIMEDQGVIKPKKDGTVRFCIDYRKVNEVTEKVVIPFQGLKIISTH